MKRNQFLKNTLAFTAGSILFSCKNEMVFNFLSLESTDSSDINEAKDWFQNVYLKEFNNPNARIKGGDKKYKRVANWDKAKKNKDLKNQECILVPIGYENADTPGFIIWDENTSYKQKMAKYYAQPILESLVVYKDKGKYYSFLVQISYDRFNLRKKGSVIDFDRLTGFMLKADWDDNIIDGAKLIDGKISGTFSSTKRARVSSCFSVSTHTTVSVTSCGPSCYDVTFTLNTGSSQMYCFDDGGGLYQSVLPPDLAAGGSGYNPTYDYVRRFNPKSAVCNPNSNDRATLNQNLNDAVNALGLTADISGFTWDKAEAIARSTGGNFDNYWPEVGVIGKRIGMVGIALDGYQVIVGITDGDFSWDMNGDLGNTLQLTLGVAGLLLHLG